MAVSLCIHGHFYQPPREDPWLGAVLAENSAAPMLNWNERILRESYAPLAFARRLDAEGHITDILNCYEWISFNAGPTLLKWMREAAPKTLERMRRGDANSLARWGHGNALAQVYHHVIMPLADAEDRALEIRWAIADFRHWFGREPEGMWLSECAVDTPTLESLAEQGIRFVLLAPRQARAVVQNGQRTPVTEMSLNIGESYKIALPSGASVTALFYHGRLSQSIAFEGLLRNGENFWQRIASEAGALTACGGASPLLTIATDGETYGHHFTFGEMALAYALAQGHAHRDGLRLTNLTSFIAANPPIREVELHEPSSWSCAHGIERWRGNCGCSDGGHPGWNQIWRGPLRKALDIMRAGVKKHFADVAKDCFADPAGALMAYGEVLADPDKSEGFAARWFSGPPACHDKAWKLLSMQEQSLAAFASCAWFFDDIARIEPENGLTFALRATDLVLESGGPDLKPAMLEALRAAVSNDPEAGSGEDVFTKEVLPRRNDAATLCLLAWVLEEAAGRRPEPGRTSRCDWPEVSVELYPEKNGDDCQTGSALIRARHETTGSRYAFHIRPYSKCHVPGRPFRPLSETEIRIRHEHSQSENTRRVAELSAPLRDYLVSCSLEQWEEFHRPELLGVAAHAASLARPWSEAQRDLTRPGYWFGIIPYLVVECMYGNILSDEQRRQVEVFLSLHFSKRAKALATTLVENAVITALENGDKSDDTLATWARRVRHVMPDMDWWHVQNVIWERGLSRYPLLAKELGFR
ncbi:MAG: DUF3536 domain-containing protein [Desulfovibrio sp.]|jgi:hypothetical protein|nr:DUF3536 domain-containing protein [Desulfovibrio sp.]